MWRAYAVCGDAATIIPQFLRTLHASICHGQQMDFIYRDHSNIGLKLFRGVTNHKFEAAKLLQNLVGSSMIKLDLYVQKACIKMWLHYKSRY